MGGPGLRFLRGAQRWLGDEARKNKLVREDASVAHLLDVENWTLTTTTEDTPQQDNGWDCGVFTCMFAKYISADLTLNFSCRDMPWFREEITWDILRQRSLRSSGGCFSVCDSTDILSGEGCELNATCARGRGGNSEGIRWGIEIGNRATTKGPRPKAVSENGARYHKTGHKCAWAYAISYESI